MLPHSLYYSLHASAIYINVNDVWKMFWLVYGLLFVEAFFGKTEKSLPANGSWKYGKLWWSCQSTVGVDIVQRRIPKDV